MKTLKHVVLTCATTALLSVSTLATAEPFIGEIAWVPYNFTPQGWASCDGQLLQVNQNTALFSLLGTTYGGDGRTTFGLPDLRSRVMVHMGQGPGLSQYRLGEQGGEETVTLTVNQMPAHSHSLNGSSEAPTDTDPTGNVPASPSRQKLYGASANVQMDESAIGYSGGGQGHNNVQPYTVLRCIIALQGIYPTRN